MEKNKGFEVIWYGFRSDGAARRGRGGPQSSSEWRKSLGFMPVTFLKVREK